MIDCGMVADKMALVVHGQASWTAAEAAHLTGCAECASSWRLVQTAPGLGATAAGRVNVQRITRQLHERMARERRARRWSRTGWLTGLAAAAALSMMVWNETTPGPAAPPAVAAVSGSAFQVPLAELEGLDGDQLEAVLEALDAPLGSTGDAPNPAFDDLDDSQLERVLRSLEG